jgi:putative alpha-1,2-mannosidase
VPGVGGLALGSPLFEDAIVHLGGGQVLHVVGHGAADDAPYITALLVDGMPYDSTWIAWDRLKDGATLDFSLTAPAP